MDELVKKPLVDPLCLCGEPHPCVEHGHVVPEPRLFEVPPVRVEHLERWVCPPVLPWRASKA